MPSYISYKQSLQKSVDADDSNIESWITVKGNHIPVMKGQSKEEAVKSFIEKKGGKSAGSESTNSWTMANGTKMEIKGDKVFKTDKDGNKSWMPREAWEHLDDDGNIENGMSNKEPTWTPINNTKSKQDESWGGSHPKFEKLTEKYMPKTGESDNELGEVLRSINQVAYRFYNDGDMWNKGYGKETVNWAVKHLTELAKNKNTPKHIAKGLENGLFEMKKYGIKDKDRYETSVKILMQTMEFASEADIDALSKMKRNSAQ